MRDFGARNIQRSNTMHSYEEHPNVFFLQIWAVLGWSTDYVDVNTEQTDEKRTENLRSFSQKISQRDPLITKFRIIKKTFEIIEEYENK